MIGLVQYDTPRTGGSVTIARVPVYWRMRRDRRLARRVEAPQANATLRLFMAIVKILAHATVSVVLCVPFAFALGLGLQVDTRLGSIVVVGSLAVCYLYVAFGTRR